MDMVGVLTPPSSSTVTPKAAAGRFLGISGMTTLALPVASGFEDAGGDGVVGAGRDDPEFVGLVGRKRGHVVGDEDQGALVGHIGRVAVGFGWDRRTGCGGGIWRATWRAPESVRVCMASVALAASAVALGRCGRRAGRWPAAESGAAGTACRRRWRRRRR